MKLGLFHWLNAFYQSKKTMINTVIIMTSCFMVLLNNLSILSTVVIFVISHICLLIPKSVTNQLIQFQPKVWFNQKQLSKIVQLESYKSTNLINFHTTFQTKKMCLMSIGTENTLPLFCKWTWLSLRHHAARLISPSSWDFSNTSM
jgi:hypothetical protein